MNKFIKTSLLFATLFMFMLIGSDEVNASSLFFEDETGVIKITELDMGDLPYNTSVTKTITIVNETTENVTISNLRLANPDKYEIVGTPATVVSAHSEITIQIKNIAGISVSSTPFETTLSFTANDGISGNEIVELPITGMIVPVKLSKVTVAGTYTYTTNSGGAALTHTFNFTGYDNALMSMSGDTSGTDAGDYTTIISLVDTINYTWDDGTTEPLQLNVNIAKSDGEPSLPDNYNNAKIGDKVSTIHLMEDWVWTNPNETIKEGSHRYSITYVGGNYNGTFVRENKTPIIGVKAHKINLDEDSNVSFDQTSGYEVLDGHETTLFLFIENGYELISVKVNGVEQTLIESFTYILKITDVTQETFVEVETRRLINSLIEPTEVPVVKVGTDQTLKFTFDKKMSWLYVNESYINGQFYTYEQTMELFNFTTGDTFGVEVKSEYLKTLPAGTYNVEIILASGELTEFSFIIEEETVAPEVTEPETNNPNTGDNIVIYVSVMVISVVGFVGFSKFKNKKI